jgi:hypothetical protein
MINNQLEPNFSITICHYEQPKTTVDITTVLDISLLNDECFMAVAAWLRAGEPRAREKTLHGIFAAIWVPAFSDREV